MSPHTVCIYQSCTPNLNFFSCACDRTAHRNNLWGVWVYLAHSLGDPLFHGWSAYRLDLVANASYWRQRADSTGVGLKPLRPTPSNLFSPVKPHFVKLPQNILIWGPRMQTNEPVGHFLFKAISVYGYKYLSLFLPISVSPISTSKAL